MRTFVVRTGLNLLLLHLAVGVNVSLAAMPAHTRMQDFSARRTEQPAPRATPEPARPSSDTPDDLVNINDCGSVTGNVNNGISITEIKPYDERALYAQLQAYEESLAQTRYPDISPLYQNVNKFQGSEVRSRSLSITGSTLPLPSIATTIGNTGTSGSTGSVTAGSTGSTTTGPDGTTTTTQATSGTTTSGTTSGTTNSFNEVTTQPSVSATIPSAAPSAPGFPTQLAYDLSPQDTLDKYTALTYQILNLRSLLNQSYSDKLIAKRGQGDTEYTFEARSQAFLGFTVSIEPKFSDHVAEVEITIRNPPKPAVAASAPIDNNESRISVISLFPEEKTYNVARITDDKKSFGAGATVSVVNIGGAYGSSDSKLYLVRDTDVVAFQRDITSEGSVTGGSDPSAASFVWQFRPVLGQKTVSPGLRKVFALVAIPKRAADSRNWEGLFSVRTRWRSQSGSGVVKDRVGTFERLKAKITKNYAPHWRTLCEGKVVIPSINRVEDALQPQVWKAKWHDNGNGLVTVIADGINFSQGTQVMIGSAVLDKPANGLSVHGERRLVLTGSAEAIAKFDPLIINRYGNTRLADVRNDGASPNPYDFLELGKPEFRLKSGSETVVRVSLTKKGTAPTDLDIDLFSNPRITPPVVQIGDSVFGLSNAPLIERTVGKDKIELTFKAPTELLRNNQAITVRELLNSKSRVSASYDGSTIARWFAVKGVQKLSSDKEDGPETMKIAIRGEGFDERMKVIAEGSTFDYAGFPIKSDTLAILSVPKTTKKVFVYGGEKGDLISINLAEPEPFALARFFTTPKDQLVVNKGDAKVHTIQGANLESIASVFFENTSLTFKVSKDKSSVDLYVPSVMTAATGHKQVTFVMKDEQRVPFTVVVQ